MKPAEQQRVLQEAVALHQAGKLADAEGRYRRILASNPRQADARHLLGLIALQRGRPDEAVTMIRAAIKLSGTDASFHNNLGEAHRALSQWAEARDAYRKAIALNPRYPSAWNNLGIVLESLGDTTAARSAYEKALALQPDYFEARHNLGILQDRLGESEAALKSLQAALALAPASAQAHSSLGTALENLGRHEEALQAFDRALRLDPALYTADYNRANTLRSMERYEEAAAGYEACLRKNPAFADALNNYAHVLIRLQRPVEAIAKARQALALKPDLASAWINLGIGLVETVDYPAAREALNKAISLNPGDFRAYSNLAMLCQKETKWKECFAAIKQALALKPDHAETLSNYGQALHEIGHTSQALVVLNRSLAIAPNRGATLMNKANVLMSLGAIDEALDSYRLSLRRSPGKWHWCSNYLYALNTSDRHSPQEVAALHFEIGRELEAANPAPRVAPPRRRSTGGRIRVGFVSPDLREHSVARFLEPLWRHHDRARWEFFAYSDADQPDGMTATLKAYVAGWRDIAGLGDAAVRELIVADELDILIDLAGHTRHNRLELFSLRPAPVLASWLGYPNTTGLTCIDYRLTDEVADPEGSAERLHTEKLIRLNGPAWCYQAPQAAPEPSDGGTAAAREVRFCSFNNPIKYSRRTLELWSRVLHAVPGSTILVKGKMFADAGARDLFTRRFGEFGIGADRLILSGWTQDGRDHFALYNQADIALDTFPYHGTTTTCEALWMGVPVVVRAGEAHVSRVGVSLLGALGLDSLVARADDEYVAIARQLAADRPQRQTFRRTLRSRMRDSVLMDGPDFARRFAVACETMMQRPPG